MNATYCPRLWNEVYITSDGNVYACCHRKPQIIGNIRENELKVIYNNEAARYLRNESLNGRLACFEDCSLLKKEIPEKINDNLIVNYGDLVKLKIEFSTACNIKCIMCKPGGKPRKDEISFEQVINSIDITPFKRIEAEGGEPLFIESARRFFDYAASKGKKVSFMTNALLINDEWAEKISRYSEFIHISLNAATKTTHESINRGSRWETVLGNIQKLRRARERFKTDIVIIGHMTIVVRNLKEIPLFIRDFKELGLDQIKFGFERSMPRYLKAIPFRKMIHRAAISKAFNRSKFQSSINTHHLKVLGLI